MIGRRRTRTALASLLLFLTASLSTAASPPCGVPDWVGAWTASPVETEAAFAGATHRAIVVPTMGGDELRVRLSNVLGPTDLVVDHVTVASALGEGPAVLPESIRDVTFAGAAAVTIPAGGERWSDPVSVEVVALQEFAVSLYVSGDPGSVTTHRPIEGLPSGETAPSFLSLPGDHTRDAVGTSFVRPTTSWLIVNGLDVRPTAPTTVVVALGDSITDGSLSTPTRDGAWPDALARRFEAAGSNVAVLNAGIAGNRVNAPGRGPSALQRLDRDVLEQSGVTDVIVLEGINDLAGGAAAAEVIDGLRTIAQRLRREMLHVIGGTLTPSGDDQAPSLIPGYSDARVRAARHAVNDWIRTSDVFDAVVDFDAAVRDPLFPDRWRPGTSYDQLHGNDLGYRLMADAIDFALLQGPACRRSVPPRRP